MYREGIPVIVISGQSNPPETVDHSLIWGWLNKPVAMEDLTTSIERAVPASRRRRASARSPIA
jgi:DNA-binding NtrC family response regulator